VLALLAVAFYFVAAQRCLNGCSNRGICVNGICLCSSGYAGADCSFANVGLNNGSSISGDLDYADWAYYNIFLPQSGGSVTFTVTSTRGDCDVYVYRNDYPTRSRWIIRDITANLNVSLTVNNATAGTWIAGVYGFDSCDYRITAFYYNPCPKQCSHHGICLKGVCLCDSGYGGADCSIHEAVTIQSNQTIQHPTTLQRGEWDYYALHLNTTVPYSFTAEMWDANGDCDLYINFDSYPTYNHYTDSNLTTKNYSTISYGSVSNHVVYIGVFGFWGCTYKLRASTFKQVDCSYLCSGHGTCGLRGCSCFSDYNGTRCERKLSALLPNQTLQGSLAAGTLNRFHFDEETAETIDIVFKSSGGILLLYATESAYGEPSLWDFDYDASASTTPGTMRLYAYGDYQRWNFALYSSSNTNYSVTVLLDSNSTVFPNYTSTPLTIGTVTNSSVMRADWKYFVFNLTQAYTFEVFARETPYYHFSGANLTMYVRFDEPPTNLVYDYTDNGDTRDHHIRVAFQDGPVTRTVYVGVHAKPDVYSYYTNFQILAWVPSFDVQK